MKLLYDHSDNVCTKYGCVHSSVNITFTCQETGLYRIFNPDTNPDNVQLFTVP